MSLSIPHQFIVCLKSIKAVCFDCFFHHISIRYLCTWLTFLFLLLMCHVNVIVNTATRTQEDRWGMFGLPWQYLSMFVLLKTVYFKHVKLIACQLQPYSLEMEMVVKYCILNPLISHKKSSEALYVLLQCFCLITKCLKNFFFNLKRSISACSPVWFYEWIYILIN